MFKVYLLQSIPKGIFYIGQTEDIDSRLEKHNKKQVKSTKHGAPWKLIGYEEYQTRREARWREYQLKKNYTEKKKFIKKLRHQDKSS